MHIWAVLFIGNAVFGQAQEVALSEVVRAQTVVSACAEDIGAMEAPANAAASLLAAGGKLWAAGQPTWVSELCGRAGGMMLIQPLGDKTPSAGDVVLFAQSDGIVLPESLRDSGACLVVFGGKKPAGDIPWFSNHAGAGSISPTLANVIPGWIFTGELVAALTRLGKMPVMYETIGLPGGFPRIDKYQAKGIFWHEAGAVPPVEAGVLGKRYVDAVNAILTRVQREDGAALRLAGTWAAEALNGGHRVIMYSMGHFIPGEMDKSAIGKDFVSEIWNSGFTAMKPPDDTYAEGDLVLHIGYQHPPRRLLAKARKEGVRVVYVDILRDRDYANDPGVLWIDPMWPWSDACVTVEGYDIDILPPSGIVNGAIAWEIHRVAMALRK